MRLQDLIVSERKAWKDYIYNPTDENYAKYQRLNDELLVELASRNNELCRNIFYNIDSSNNNN